jgi:magnesium transporter
MELKHYNYGNLKWTDCQGPTQEHLKLMAAQINVPEAMLLSCLDPDYLPYIDHSNGVIFIMLRLCELGAPQKADTIQELTTKIAVFITADHIYTFHRLKLAEIAEVNLAMEAVLTKSIEIEKNNKSTQDLKEHYLQNLIEQIANTYDKKLIQLGRETDIFEEKMFTVRNSKNLLKEGFLIKRKASAYKKVIKFTIDVLFKSCQKMNFELQKFSSNKEKLDRYQFYADDVFENIQGLLNLHIAIQSQKTNEASYRTNEIVRVLTVLTIFFLPLNFIAGVYGMNFETMPLVKTNEGFWISIGFMILISIGLLIYVIGKGWLKPPPKD